jgi:polyhydroxybutyrate depolymerase
MAAGTLVLCAAGLAAAMSRGARPDASRPDAVAACSEPRGVTRGLTVTVPGQGFRTALVHLPARARPGPIPLIVGLHPAYGDGAFMERYTGLSGLADRAGFAIAYPDAAGPHHRWTLGSGGGPDDVAFVRTLVDRLLAGGCLDHARVSAVGVSNGAGLAALLGCEAADRLAAIVAVAGDYGNLPECRPDRPLSVLEIHGTADPVVPYRGPPGDVLEWLAGWVRRDGCAPSPSRRAVAGSVTRMEWSACRSGASVTHLAIDGGVHVWPGAAMSTPGPPVNLSAGLEAWRFVQTKRS